MKNIVEWHSDTHYLSFNTDNNTLKFDGKEYELYLATNEKLIKMAKTQKAYISGNYYLDKHTMYYCVRKIVRASCSSGRNIFIDVLLYNNAYKTIGDALVNRSIGHANDTKEIEIHQVLNGSVLEVIEYNGRRYVGVFKANEYFEIPAGAFHCTYVLEDSTIVANIFGNVYWEDDYSKKPYSEYKNEVSISYIDKKFLYETESGESCLLDKDFTNISEINGLDYSLLPIEDLPITKKINLLEVGTVFDLFIKLKELY